MNRGGFRDKWPALFIEVPGDEDEIGGCLGAGKGFIHISAEGDVEPCPFAPYSDMNLRTVSLKDALNSEFLKKMGPSSSNKLNSLVSSSFRKSISSKQCKQ